jgi:hypothetical protein
MTPEEMLARLAGPLSLRRRVAAVVALCGGAAGAALVGLLWATEPGLPARTSTAFAVLVLIGLAWAGFGAWALVRRGPLFALDRVVAAWIALGATGLFAVGAVVVTMSRPGLGLAAGATSLVLLAAAGLNLHRAWTHRAHLLRRRRELGG